MLIVDSTLSNTEICSKFVKLSIQKAGPKDMQHNLIMSEDVKMKNIDVSCFVLIS